MFEELERFRPGQRLQRLPSPAFLGGVCKRETEGSQYLANDTS